VYAQVQSQSPPALIPSVKVIHEPVRGANAAIAALGA